MHEKSGTGRTPQEFTIENGSAKQERSGFDRSHEELVYAIKSYIQAELTRPVDTWGGESIAERFKDRHNPFTPEKIVADRLGQETQYVFSEKEVHKKRGKFFSPIYKAWQVIAYDRFDRSEKHYSGWSLSCDYEAAQKRNDPRPETIILTHPSQVRLLDALADACNLPHQRGQTEIEIPEKIRGYNEWLAKQRRR